MVKHKTAPWAVVCLLVATVAFFWKILLTHQFSMLTGKEDVYQGYAWLQFWTLSIWQHTAPLWDPFAFAGRSFAGEMQTAAFDPLRFVFLLFPLNRQGFVSVQLYHWWYAMLHFAGACFLYALSRSMGMRRIAAILAGLAFALGGITGHMRWPNILTSCIWLPVIFLCISKAMQAAALRRSLVLAALGGAALGMSVLAGSVHIVLEQAIAVASVGVFFALSPQLQARQLAGRAWTLPLAVCALVCAIGLGVGAVQLTASAEYSARSVRFINTACPIPADEKIPYVHMSSDNLWPHGIALLLSPVAFEGKPGGGEVISPYSGVLPLFAAIIAIWRRWRDPWVRYLTVLAAGAFLYSLGALSPLHGFLYAVVPWLWMAREASRFMYLASFAMALLAGFGIDALLRAHTEPARWTSVSRILRWTMLVCGVLIAVPAVFGRPYLSMWVSLSLLLITTTCGLVLYLIPRAATRTAYALLAGLLLFDLAAFDWTAYNRIEEARTGNDQLERVLSLRGAVNFLKSRPGLFRVHFAANPVPNAGDLYGVYTVYGSGATLQSAAQRLLERSELLNVRYIVRPASDKGPGPVYEDAGWKVYEAPNAMPRAWMVHETSVVPSDIELMQRLKAPETDFRKTALLRAPLRESLEPSVEGREDTVRFTAYRAHDLSLRAEAANRGLLVLSEIHYPGWRASVNGRPAEIVEVNGGLRGIVVPRGGSDVRLEYRPYPIWIGAAVSLVTLASVLLAAVLQLRSAEPRADVRAQVAGR